MRLGDRFLIYILLLSLLVLTGGASGYIQSADQGSEAYEEGRYDESAEHFNDAIAGGGDPDILHYNIGNAKYKAGDYEDAESSFRKASDEGDISPDEQYNLGNTLVMQAESAASGGDISAAKEYFNSAIDAYGKALELDYSDVDAIHNLEYVKRRLQELEKQEQTGEEADESSESDSGEEETQGEGDQEQEGDESSDQQQQDGSSDEGASEQESGDEDRQDGFEQEQSESDPGAGRPDPENDGLGLTEEQIESLLDYYEQKEQMLEDMQGYGIPIQPWDSDLQGGIWDEFFGRAPEESDDWIDW
jgi:tetratricopeptide (TPR) repeat protein